MSFFRGCWDHRHEADGLKSLEAGRISRVAVVDIVTVVAVSEVAVAVLITSVGGGRSNI